MTNKPKFLITIVGLLTVILLAACSGTTTTIPCPTAFCPVSTPCPTSAPAEAAVKAPFEDLWAASPHADKTAAAFTHWDEESPAEIPVGCAKCHSGTGFAAYAENGAVDKAQPVGTVITCDTCHSDATAKLTSVTFPSEVVVTNLGREAVCISCHQGVASMKQVDAVITTAGVTDPDVVSDKITFTNIHYMAAAVARYGTQAKGGYEYEGKTYDAYFAHVDGFSTCTDCHDSHSLELKTESCTMCHEDVKTVEDVREIRMVSSTSDYDGDGDVTEGIAGEIEGLQALLLTTMQSYAKEVAGTGLVYSAEAYPYFFVDTNGDGKPGEDETVFANSYKAWTARLSKAAFNYQLSVKDPGGYAHGGKYIIELLYDSIEDVNSALKTPGDLAKIHRGDAGHFDGSSMAFRDWDDTGMVPGRCAKCHSATGLPQFITEAAVVSQPSSNGFSCHTCHSDMATLARYEVKSVTFPSGAKISFDETGETAVDDNLCLMCHQGRESTTSVNTAVKDMDPDTVNEKLTFKNIHYFAAGATIFGTQAKGMYEYEGKEYLGEFKHEGNLFTCSSCHDVHSLQVATDTCKTCHQVDDPAKIRFATSDKDYNGNGDVEEGIKAEVDGLRDQLYAAVKKYAADTLQKPIVYSPSAYPYWFNDTNANGELDADEAKSDNSYKSWTPRLLKAAFNLQASIKDTGAYVHNGKYVMQILYDSIADLAVKTGVQPVGVRP